jgi:hypothetical protein
MGLKNIYVRVISGRTKNGTGVQNTVFRLLSHLQSNEIGLFITVDGKDVNMPGIRNGRNRIYLDKSTDCVILDSKKTGSEIQESEVDNTPSISDDEIAQDLEDTFNIIAEMTQAVTTGVVKGLVISGPAGVSKSHTVEKALSSAMGGRRRFYWARSEV